MKSLFGIAAALAIVGTALVTTAPADARGVTSSQTRVGPRVVAPRINPWRVPPRTERRITGPRESGRGVGCRYIVTGRQPIVHINPRTGRSETTYITTGYTRCPIRI